MASRREEIVDVFDGRKRVSVARKEKGHASSVDTESVCATSWQMSLTHVEEGVPGVERKGKPGGDGKGGKEGQLTDSLRQQEKQDIERARRIRGEKTTQGVCLCVQYALSRIFPPRTTTDSTHLSHSRGYSLTSYSAKA